MGKPFVGILIHPWDVKEEGIGSVTETLSGFGISSVFLGVNASAEDHPPQPIDARLTHNPKRKRYVSEEGRFYYEIDPSYHPNSVAMPKRTSDSDLIGFDVLRDTEDFSEAGLSRFAWLTSLHNGQMLDDGQELALVNIIGEADRNWMCPNNPNVAIELLELINEMQGRYDLEGVLLDNFWWKYPHTFMHSLESGMSCFCEHCRHRMEIEGIGVRDVKRALSQICRRARSLDQGDIARIGGAKTDQLLKIVELPVVEGGGYSDILNVLFEDPKMRDRLPELAENDPLGIFQWLMDHPVILDWLEFKSDALYRLLESVYSLAKSNDPDFQVGLGMWSPRSSWSVGQKYVKLKDACDWMMPMFYHRIWGWYSTCVAEELFEIIHPKTPSIFASYKDILTAWFKLAGYAGSNLRSKIVNGLSSDQMKKEIDRSRELVGPGFPLYAGIQLWEPGSKIPHPQEAAETTQLVLESDVQGIIVQAYGWIFMPNLQASSKVLKRFIQTPPSPSP